MHFSKRSGMILTFRQWQEIPPKWLLSQVCFRDKGLSPVSGHRSLFLSGQLLCAQNLSESGAAAHTVGPRGRPQHPASWGVRCRPRVVAVRGPHQLSAGHRHWAACSRSPTLPCSALSASPTPASCCLSPSTRCASGVCTVDTQPFLSWCNREDPAGSMGRENQRGRKRPPGEQRAAVQVLIKVASMGLSHFEPGSPGPGEERPSPPPSSPPNVTRLLGILQTCQEL